MALWAKLNLKGESTEGSRTLLDLVRRMVVTMRAMALKSLVIVESPAKA